MSACVDWQSPSQCTHPLRPWGRTQDSRIQTEREGPEDEEERFSQSSSEQIVNKERCDTCRRVNLFISPNVYHGGDVMGNVSEHFQVPVLELLTGQHHFEESVEGDSMEVF